MERRDQCSHKDVGTRLREYEIIELRATLLDARPTPPSGGSFREGKLSLPLALIAYLNLGALQKFIHVRKVHFNLEGT